jgi:hypothetical protein
MRLFDGLGMITGFRDSGKSLFALTHGTRLDLIHYLDHDIKTGQVLEQLGGTSQIGSYHNLLASRAKMTELAFHDYCRSIIAAIPVNRDQAIIWDNFTPFEETCYPKLMLDPNKYKQSWAPLGSIKGAQQHAAASLITQDLIDEMLMKAGSVWIIYHLKYLNKAGVNTDKLIPRAPASSPVIEKANFVVWTMVGPSGGAPIGLIIKRPAKMELTDTGIPKVTNVFPRRVFPCTWEKLAWYWANPFGEKVPEKDERPSEFELSILDNNLTADQRRAFELAIQFGKPVEEDIANQLDINAMIKQYKADNPAATVAEIRTALELTLTPPEIMKILNS